MPEDAIMSGTGDGYRHVGEVCEVLFGDGSWHPVTLLSWRRDRLGRWVAQVEWFAAGGTWTESYLYSPGKIRPG
jgi:hypothetical protein